MYVLGSLLRSLTVRWRYPLAAALIFVVSLSARAQTAGDSWTVLTMDGAVVAISSASERLAINPGQPIGDGTSIGTSADGTIVLTRRGDTITVYPNSEMTIPDTAGAGGPGVLQDFGKLLYRMESRESWDFKIHTPFLAATVKGTTFTVVVEQSRATVSVAEGQVRVETASGDHVAMVDSAETATVTKDRDDTVTVVSAGNGAPRRTGSSRDRSRDRDSRGSDSRGGDSRGDDSQGDDSQGDDSQGDDSQGDQQ